jgi:hypothetical protein
MGGIALGKGVVLFMACGAGHGAVARQIRVIEQPPAQFDARIVLRPLRAQRQQGQRGPHPHGTATASTRICAPPLAEICTA